jgi:hypothetical protein
VKENRVLSKIKKAFEADTWKQGNHVAAEGSFSLIIAHVKLSKLSVWMVLGDYPSHLEHRDSPPLPLHSSPNKP